MQDGFCGISLSLPRAIFILIYWHLHEKAIFIFVWRIWIHFKSSNFISFFNYKGMLVYYVLYFMYNSCRMASLNLSHTLLLYLCIILFQSHVLLVFIPYFYFMYNYFPWPPCIYYTFCYNLYIYCQLMRTASYEKKIVIGEIGFFAWAIWLLGRLRL